MCSSSYLAISDEDGRRETIVSLEGKVDVKPAGEENWYEAEEGSILKERDIVRTRPNSSATINLDEDGKTATIEIKENSQLLFSEMSKNEESGTQNTLLDLAVGEMMITAKKLDSPESKFEVKTPTSMFGVKEAKFGVKVEAMNE